MKPKPPVPPPPPHVRAPRYTVILATTVEQLEALAEELINGKMRPQGSVQMRVDQQGANPPTFIFAQAFYRHYAAGRDPTV